jgi:hypothetical protein
MEAICSETSAEFHRTHSVISQKTEFVIITSVRTTNRTEIKDGMCDGGCRELLHTFPLNFQPISHLYFITCRDIYAVICCSDLLFDTVEK